MSFASTHTVVNESGHTSPPGWQQSAGKINIVKRALERTATCTLQCDR